MSYPHHSDEKSQFEARSSFKPPLVNAVQIVSEKRYHEMKIGTQDLELFDFFSNVSPVVQAKNDTLYRCGIQSIPTPIPRFSAEMPDVCR